MGNSGGGGGKQKDEDKKAGENQAAETAKRMAEMEGFFSKYREDIQRNHTLLLQIQDVYRQTLSKCIGSIDKNGHRVL